MERKTGHRLFLDGNAWCAVGPHFKCLATDPAGFGGTQQEAVDQLLADPSYRSWLIRINGIPPTLADFTVESPTFQ